MAKNGFYAVANGRNVGVYTTWAQCSAQVNGYPSARYKKFNTESEALAFIANYQLGCKSGNSTCGATVTPTTVALATRTSIQRSDRKRKTSESLPELSHSTKRTEDCYSGIWKDAAIVYTDGACSNNGRGTAKAGYGIYWGPDHRDNAYGPVHGAATNNRGELLAVDIALKQAIQKKLQRIVVRTDSQLLIKSMDEYMKKWKKNSWRTSTGGEVKNQDLLRSIDASTGKIQVKFEYVPGHSGVSGNEAADELARRGATMYEENV
ncbi:hypothetical protein KIN20_015903 [Parelaphostrongylus tenuis]|uniref:Ribonuclease H1 n=1 Tax=Parelaphostrongylus tenuis TaxID=148309 RepID=A0AAD5MFM9_PARTN|nr:hypothetical protein KIN20_015903 [Parelaphostrongylus tenuis]